MRLHEVLSAVPGVKAAYYAPPASIQMVYPCFLYSLEGVPSTKADNLSYLRNRRWSVTLITEESETDIFDYMLNLPFSEFDRHYVADGLNHFVFTLYF